MTPLPPRGPDRFAYNRPLRQSERVQVANVTYDRKTGVTIKELKGAALEEKSEEDLKKMLEEL